MPRHLFSDTHDSQDATLLPWQGLHSTLGVTIPGSSACLLLSTAYHIILGTVWFACDNMPWIRVGCYLARRVCLVLPGTGTVIPDQVREVSKPS